VHPNATATVISGNDGNRVLSLRGAVAYRVYPP